MLTTGIFRNKWWMVVAAVLGLMLNTGVVQNFAFAVFIKPITEDLGISRATLTLGARVIGALLQHRHHAALRQGDRPLRPARRPHADDRGLRRRDRGAGVAADALCASGAASSSSQHCSARGSRRSPIPRRIAGLVRQGSRPRARHRHRRGRAGRRDHPALLRIISSCITAGAWPISAWAPRILVLALIPVALFEREPPIPPERAAAARTTTPCRPEPDRSGARGLALLGDDRSRSSSRSSRSTAR